MRLCADLSHYVIDREMRLPLTDLDRHFMLRVLERADSFQGRIANREQIQADPCVSLCSRAAHAGSSRASMAASTLSAVISPFHFHTTRPSGSMRNDSGTWSTTNLALAESAS